MDVCRTTTRGLEVNGDKIRMRCDVDEKEATRGGQTIDVESPPTAGKRPRTQGGFRFSQQGSGCRCHCQWVVL